MQVARQAQRSLHEVVLCRHAPDFTGRDTTMLLKWCCLQFEGKYARYLLYSSGRTEDKMKAEVRMQVRIPLTIRDALARDAKNNHRSMNGQLIAILTEHFRAIRLDFELDDADRKSNHRE